MNGDDTSEVLQVGPIKVWYDRRIGIAIAAFDPGAELVVEYTRPFTEALIKVTGGEVRPLIVDFKNMKSQTKECRDYFAKDPTHAATHSATALVVNSALTRMIANFFIGLNKAVKPVRLFDDRESAIRWLQSLPGGKP
jgi:hypothetical protein